MLARLHLREHVVILEVDVGLVHELPSLGLLFDNFLLFVFLVLVVLSSPWALLPFPSSSLVTAVVPPVLAALVALFVELLELSELLAVDLLDLGVQLLHCLVPDLG